MKRKKSEVASAEVNIDEAQADAIASEDEGLIDANKLREAAMCSLARMIALAESDEVHDKLKFEIYKWICQMHFGKPSSASQRCEGGERSLILTFEGELEKWSS